MANKWILFFHDNKIVFFYTQDDDYRLYPAHDYKGQVN